jgi:hypothetical protein
MYILLKGRRVLVVYSLRQIRLLEETINSLKVDNNEK